ncbi:ankyrin repeat-containing domain protein [Podospora aff. communis PSN243]|uniref:Ankyrin repeat-containing domain protein n=1 Tax=Podospora aff. communis PSN243 TaxID=3040156 RepID=A0AAV9GRJ4_9PEZI|nr:ankyrin repeat-containing domain protein [Podospora aff. communis PSN243]
MASLLSVSYVGGLPTAERLFLSLPRNPFRRCRRPPTTGKECNDGALPLACCSGDMQTVRRLLANGASPASADHYFGTPVYAAVVGGHVDIVKLLADEHGASLDKTTFHRRGTPLSWAIFAGRLNIVQILLASPRVDPNARAGGQVPLAGAIKQKRWGIVRCLLDSPALDINRRAKRIWSSRLHADPNFEQLWLVELLLTRGLDPNVLDKSKKTILWHAVEANCQEVVDMLFAVNGEALDPNMAWDSRILPLQLAVRNGDAAVVECLLKSGKVDIDARNGCTAVYQAAYTHCDLAILKLLLDHGADTAIPDTFGYTLLRRARQDGKMAAIEMVLDHLRSRRGRTKRRYPAGRGITVRRSKRVRQ